jgi:putative PIN family toxin of toxin-antitoxin system
VLRLVLDTNTVLSALLWGGTPARLITAARAREIALWSSPALLEELRGVIHREKFAQRLAERGLSAGILFDGYATLCQLATPQAIPRTSIDADDDKVLATGLAARAHLIVSGDHQHLVSLKQFHGIPIITAAQAVVMVEAR